MTVLDLEQARAAQHPESSTPSGDTPGGIALPATLRILFGSEMGNAEIVADRLGEALAEHGLETECVALDDQPLAELGALGVTLIVTSTSGEGDMPYNADRFWKALAAEDAPSLAGLRYAVLALGDTGYTYFCGAGVKIDARLEELGATRIAERVDCDVSYDIPAAAWIAARVAQLFGSPDGEHADEPVANPRAAVGPAVWTREYPFDATLIATRLLSGAGSAKEIRHYEIDLSGADIDYRPGDSIGIVPTNDPIAVSHFLQAAGVSGDELHDGESFAFLAEHRWELRFPSAALLDAVVRLAPDSDLARAVAGGAQTVGDHSAQEEWVRSHGVIEALRTLPAPLPPAELAALMSPIRYRAYSIASSPRVHPHAVHLTVATQRNPAGCALASGVGSGFLADRLQSDFTVRVFPVPNRVFRLPDDPAVPIIMVGPGVGVAPFRGFLADRAQHEHPGPAWLFYGDQHEATDFSYREEWEQFLADGTLTRLDTAFSRDQPQKLYVQDRLRENAAEVVQWLRDGAYFYVCGDGKSMAADVDEALSEIAAAQLGEEGGAALLAQLHR
ncbi:MAG: sulfite reductase flavoprotein subunit alpha, partial [Protaetiibacter sp.]